MGILENNSNTLQNDMTSPHFAGSARKRTSAT